MIHGDSPFLHLFNSQPDYTFLRTFGCACWPNLRPYNERKLQFRSKRCVFLGYSSMHKGYKCLDPSEGHIYISRDVIFYESVFPFTVLHPNAGVRLRSEISLLPDMLLNPPNTSLGDVSAIDPNVPSSVPTNIVSSSTPVVEDAGENASQFDASSMENGGHFMCQPSGDSTHAGVAASSAGTACRSGSSSGS